VQGDYTVEYADPVRPAEIVDADSMRTVPLAVGALLATAATIALVSAVVISVRSRRRELGTLRALGFTGRQLRTSVRVQAAATMAVAMAIGVPLGLVVGRLAWRSFAARLGVVTEPTMPWLWIAATVAGGLVVAVAAAAVPARIASRVDVSRALRAD
jgi:putative ABC transport system permease protein